MRVIAVLPDLAVDRRVLDSTTAQGLMVRGMPTEPEAVRTIIG